MRHTRVRLFRVAALTILSAAAAVSGLSAQEPPDTVLVTDSVAAVDTLFADSLQVPDSLTDSLSADTIFYNMPAPERARPAGFATGVWVWDRHAIMADGANTLAELLRTVPGITTLLGGDYGTPAAVSALGAAGGGYRVVRDGFELAALEGSVPDLQLIGLGGIARVRLERSMGRTLIELTSHRYDDGRPFSVVEAGTGDLDTNLFRGVFADPTALGGSLAAALERVDTRGRGRDRAEGGNRTGSWVRYQFHLRDRAAIGIDYRRMSAQTRVEAYVPTRGRTDLSARLGVRVLEGVTLGVQAGRSSWDVDGAADSVDLGGSRTQLAATAAFERGPLWVRGSWRSFEGTLPERRFDAAAGWVSPRWGGVSVRAEQGRWNAVDARNYGAGAWVSPTPFLTLFASAEEGDFGSRAGPLLERPGRPPFVLDREVPPGVEAVTARRTGRAGGVAERWGVTLGAAALYTWADSIRPLGLQLDEGGAPVAGVHRNGWEGFAVLPMPFWQGLTLQGSYVQWDEEGPYLPLQSYQASFEFNRVYKESGNLEFWASFGVRGHDPMLVFIPDDGSGVPGLARVPFFQSWYTQIQVRVVTVRLWLGMDNFTFRRSLQKFPDRRLPFGRSFFALRWDLWN